MSRPPKPAVNAGEAIPLIPDAQMPAGAARLPDIADLMKRLRFSPADGRIWLNHQRMLLIHSRAMGVLRRELVEGLGIDRARGLLTRMGYFAGALDAQMAREVRSSDRLEDAFLAGPQMHSLEGIVRVEPVELTIDVAKGVFYGEFIWHNSSEDEEHIRDFGIGPEGACWMQIGYASGYTTTFIGRPVLFREVECRAKGDEHCRIVGKPVEEWRDAADDLRFLQVEDFTQGVAAAPGAPQRPLPAAESRGVPTAFGNDDMVGASPGFNSACHLVRRVAGTDATVLITGESGVGKEVFARALHRISARSDKPFVALNCATIPEQLIESELFGVEKGAYTGALASRAGRFERADSGTLFLDEVGILSMSAQGKLLRALQEGELERLGDHQTRRVDVRIIAATNVNLRDEVDAGRFREDLFFRLNVFPIRIPSLRERREDVPILMHYFLEKFKRRHHRELTGFTARAIDAMLSYDWPGNIRELENVLERGVILATEGGPVDVAHLFTSSERFDAHHFALDYEGGLTEVADARQSDPAGIVTEAFAPSRFDHVTRRVSELLSEGERAPEDADTPDDAIVSLEEIENALVSKAVERARGNLSAAARLLGMTRSQLVYRIKSRSLMASKA